MLIFTVVFYFILAKISKKYSKIQLHSVFHCINSVFFSSLVFHKNDISLYTINIMSQLNPIIENNLMFLCVTNTLSYFIADTIDILIDENKKRRIYLLHHVIAALGLSTFYFGNNASIFAIWCLEIGGLVHHAKHICNIYIGLGQNQALGLGQNQAYESLKSFVNFSYFFVYTFSRIYFFINVFSILSNNYSYSDLINVFVGVVLFIQNSIWLVQNCVKI